jgi:MerR family transcriptional regulator, light-induced transcriptional regulator
MPKRALSPVNENSAVANELRIASEAIAQAAVARDYQRRPALLAKYGERGRAMYLQDTRFHLSYLADAISFGRPSIFKDYLGWVSAVLEARGVAAEDLVENLKCVRETLVETLLGDRLAVVLEVFDAGLAGVGGAAGASADQSDLPLLADGLAKRYLDFLLHGERQAALELVQNAIRAGTSIREIWLRVFQDAQREVGRLWQSNQISIAQEHYCTAATQMIMSRLYSHVFSGPRRGRVLMTACAPGEIHELGMRMVADISQMDGWDTYHLGANMPAAALADFVAQRRPDLLGLSATMTFHLEPVAAMVRALRASQETRDVRILVGGHAFNREPELWRDIDADGYARDAESALTAAERVAAAAKS